MKRSKHSLSFYKLLTCDMGELVPVGLVEVLPGDTFQQSSSALIRCSPMLAPVMHPVVVRIHHWFVPHRLVWDGWEDFITGGDDGLGGDAGTYPTITFGGGGAAVGGLADHMGIPSGIAGIVANAMPFRSYNKIFNEYYRDQDLVTEVTQDSVTIQEVAWEKDYFTSARPWPQKGPEVTLPLGTSAPVLGLGVSVGETPLGSANVIGAGGAATYANRYTPSADVFMLEAAGAGMDALPLLRADLTNATAVAVDDVRRAFALQRYQEARARYGSRYVEYLRYLGVRPSDARLQRPEYLGGGKQTISFSEVLQTGGTSAGAATGVGNMAGHGIAAMRSRQYRKFFEEHGFVLSLLSVRPRSMYVNGLDRMWSRRTKEDYWQKELENIGQQEVRLDELYAAGTAADDDVWGYQDRYAEYRHRPSRISGEFRTTLNYWHMGRVFASAPTLNQSFTDCTPSKRNFASQSTDVLWIMVSHNIRARRMVGANAAGRIL